VESLAGLLRTVVPDDAQNTATWSTWSKLAPHVEAIGAAALALDRASVDLGRLIDRLATFLEIYCQLTGTASDYTRRAEEALAYLKR